MDAKQQDAPETQVSQDAAEALGRFVVVWGSIEHELEAIITAMFVVPPVFRSSITIGLTLDPKINMIINALAVGGPHLLDSGETENFYKILERLRDLISEHRNVIFHSIVVPAKANGQLYAAKFTGGKRPRLKQIPLTPAYLRQAVERIASCRNELRVMHERVKMAFGKSETVFLRRASKAALEAELRSRKFSEMRPDEWVELSQERPAGEKCGDD